MYYQFDEQFNIDCFRELINTPSPVGYDILMNPVLEKYAAKLIEIGYQGRLTLECNWRPDHETHIKEAVEVFNLFRKV